MAERWIVWDKIYPEEQYKRVVRADDEFDASEEFIHVSNKGYGYYDLGGEFTFVVQHEDLKVTYEINHHIRSKHED